VEVLPVKEKLLYRVALVNGHKVLAYPRGRKQVLPRMAPGDRVWLEMSPFDFSKGRLLRKQE
jgi:translation initiation factor IF-1